MENTYIFDKDFYTNFYGDIKNAVINFNIDPYEHYINHGKIEGRVYCQNELDDIIYENKLLIDFQHTFLQNEQFQNDTENKLNILVRTSKRPELFKQCIESILSQKYTNYHIYICYDTIESYEYIKDYLSNSNITCFFVQNDSTEKYKFNLYNNELMDKVEDGFILFLDDDDIYCHDMCFKIINEYISDSDSLLIWKFMRPDKLIYPKSIDNINLGEIDTTMVCFHSKYKDSAKWPDCQCGDYFFFRELFKNLSLNISEVEFILTKTIYHDRMGNSVN